jgi:hypothetical protein
MDSYDEKAPNLRQSLLHNTRLVVNALLELRAIDETQQIWLVVCSHHLGQDSASSMLPRLLSAFGVALLGVADRCA